MMLYILERIEDGSALVEASGAVGVEWLRLPRAALPPCAREGDVLLPQGQGWQVDEAATTARRQALRARFAGLGKNTKGESGGR